MNLHTRARRALLLSATVGALSLAHTRDAAACGGLFCNQGTGQAVDQTGENIVFFLDGKSVEAHIQIQYAGTAARFAWVLPVPVNPDAVEIGSAPMITRLLNATGPTYSSVTLKACPTCGEIDPFGGGPSGGVDNGNMPPAPTVVQKGSAGAFDYVVLQGGTADTLLTWLNDNKYQQSPDAIPILASYLAKGFLFVAVRLVNGAEVEDIHPLVVRYAGDTPCVPIKLTRIAAKENMKIRTFFLDTSADARWVPTNYRHVTLNPLVLDHLTNGSNYAAAIDAAVDSPVADGHAFVTESLGQKPFLPPITSPLWNTKALATESALSIVTALSKQAFMQCGLSVLSPCQYASPLVLSTLHDYLPTPPGLSDTAFHMCVSCYEKQLDLSKWDAAAFAQALETRVVVPSKHAEEILAASKHLTRMLTSLSPAEMTEDPEFHRITDATPQSNFHNGAHYLGCDGGGDWMVNIGPTPFALSPANTWPAWDASMPSAAKIEEFAVGANAPITLVDNGAKIAASLAAWNAWRNIPMQFVPPMMCGGPPGTGGAAGAQGSPSTAGKSGATQAGGASVGSGGSTGGAGASPMPQAEAARASAAPEAEGGCSTSGSDAPAALSLWLLALVVGARIKRRRA